MARTNTETQGETPAASGIDYAALPDSLIYMSVEGYIGFLPFDTLPGADAAANAAYNEGRKQLALRKAQVAAKRAVKESKPVQPAIQAALDAFVPDSEMSFQTVASRRDELTRELMAEKLRAIGKDAPAKAILDGGDFKTPDGGSAVAAFGEKYASEVASRLAAWATAYVAPTRRGSGASGLTTEVLDVDL